MGGAELEIIHVSNESGETTVVVAVSGTPIVGVDDLLIAGDDKGAYISLKLRRFRFVEHDPSVEEPEEESEEEGPPDKIDSDKSR